MPSAVAGAYVFADRASLSDLQSYLTLARQADPEAAVRLHALGLPELPSELKVAAVLTCALPPFSVLPSLAEPYGEADRGAASMMLATALSFLTLSGWMIVLQGFGWL